MTWLEQPEGGVVEGQEFMVDLPEDFKGLRIEAPTGRWKDGIFGCFNYGICHPSLCCACFCTQLAMAQVMTRMKLTYLGEPGSRSSTMSTFKIVALLFICYTIYSIALEIAAPSDEPTTPLISTLKALGGICFSLYALYAMMKTREFVREKHSIPEGRLGVCEDLLCSLCCSCCAVSQMARHTGEYERYNGACCSARGLTEAAPLNV